jgi:hypothetical protein
MGYRTYIGEMPKREYNKIKSLTEDDLIAFYGIEKEDDGNWYKGVYEFGSDLHEFGKYTDFEPPKKSIKPFFKNKDLMSRYKEYDFYIATPEFLAYIIESYKQRTAQYYNKMLIPFFGAKGSFSEREKPSLFLNSIKTHYGIDNQHEFDFSLITKEEQTALFLILEHMKSMRVEWTIFDPYDLTKGSSITTSWKYEYCIFELVRIYKSFDWKRKVMIYYGY